MYRLFELDPISFSGHYSAWESTLTPESKQLAVQELQLALEGKKEFNTTFEIQTPSGGRKHIGGMGKVLRNSSGVPIVMYGMNWDKTREVTLQKSFELERSKATQNAKLASLGEMSAGIAHEINNPMAIISGAVAVIETKMQGSEKVAEKLSMIKKAVARVSRIVNGLRKFSRTTDKKNLAPHNLGEVIKEVVVLTEPKSKKFDVPVKVTLESSAQVLGDEVELEQVLVNLIQNAIDAVKNLAEKWVEVRAFDTASEVVVYIRDSGNGISEELEAKMFQPFFTTKAVGEGTGLGLSIARGILEEHKATIGVLRTDKHTCFELRFPKMSAQAANLPKAA